MRKAFLVIDIPSCCNECPICASYAESAFSIREYWCTVSDNISVDPDDKPRWCPLKPVPEKYDIEAMRNKPHDIDCDWEFESGYNTCIDDILEE